MSLPAADDLFRQTGEAARARAEQRPVRAVGDDETEPSPAAPKRPSGRIRHDEKMTVYITSDELIDLEHARLDLRRSHGLAVDRGRLVREAVALVLADYDANGSDSALVRLLLAE